MRLFRYPIQLFTLLLIFFSSLIFAQDAIQPVIPGDFADPTVIRVNNKYFSVGTSSEWAPHFPVFTSSDLLTWTQMGYVFDHAPEWASGSFWAPEYDYHDGTYFIYYTARRKGDNISCIGVATSKYPDKGFIDHGVIIEYGKEAIDGFVFLDQGIRYITFKAYGLDQRPIEILGLKLSKDGLHTEGEPFSMLKDGQRLGLEGQSILKKDDYYYLFYSAGNCCGIACSYNVRVARSKSFAGPYEQYAGNPLLMENAFYKCSGHGTFVKDTQGKYFYLYHAYDKKTMVSAGRQGMLAELSWPESNAWPVFKEISGPKSERNLKMTFMGASLDKKWQWDFRNALPAVVQTGGEIQLSGRINPGNLTGIALTVRPVSGVFEAITNVTKFNQALQGLTYYGDANAAVGVGVSGNKVCFWVVKNKIYKILSSERIQPGKPVALKLTTLPDGHIVAFFKQGNQHWKNMRPEVPVQAEFLQQWDRSPRVGLHFKGQPKEKASFSSFELKYTE